MIGNNNDLEKQAEFLLRLMDFMRTYTQAVADAIRKLAELQEDLPKQYKRFKEFIENPAMVTEILEKIPDEYREKIMVKLFNIFMKINVLTYKIRKVYDLDLKEQKALADAIEDLVMSIDETYNWIKELSEGKGNDRNKNN